MRERGRDIGKERSSPCREPSVGLDPGIPGSCPGPKAGIKLLSHPGTPMSFYIKIDHSFILFRVSLLQIFC